MIKCFDLDSKQIRIRDILTDKPFFEIEIYAISDAKPNRNMSYFTPESMKKGIETFTDKPILGFFNKQDDFESHNGKAAYDPELEREYWDNSNGEQILGFVRSSDHKEIVEKSDGRLWIVCTAMICSQYNYKQVKRLLKDKHKKISVEVSIKKSEVIDDIEYIYDFELMGITILGSRNGIPVREGIEGAHLSVLDMFDQRIYAGQKQALMFEYSQLDNKNKEGKDLAKDDIGTKNAFKIEKSKEAMSDTKWEEVNKTESCVRMAAASNFKEIAGDVFLDLREGWEDGEVSKLKYPVMQFASDDTLVYNRDALASAKAYAEKNGEEKVLEKLKSIYEHLDLDFESEGKVECSQFCDLYEDCDCGCGGDDHGDDDHDDDNHGDGDEHDENNCGNMAEDGQCADTNQPEDGQCADTNQPEDKQNEECNVLEMKCKELESKCGDYEAKIADYEAKIADYEAKIAEFETKVTEFETKVTGCEAKISEYEEKYKDYEEIKTALEAANEKFAEIKVADQKAYIDEVQTKMSLMSEDIQEIRSKCEKHEYESNENIDKDIAYVVFQKKMASVNSKTTEFAVNINPEVIDNQKSSRKIKTVQERLKDNLK